MRASRVLRADRDDSMNAEPSSTGRRIVPPYTLIELIAATTAFAIGCGVFNYVGDVLNHPLDALDGPVRRYHILDRDNRQRSGPAGTVGDVSPLVAVKTFAIPSSDAASREPRRFTAARREQR